jgi:hypothetical protein
VPVGPPLPSATELEVLGHVALHEGSGGPARVSGARFAHPLKHQSRSVTVAGQGRRARSSIWRRFAVGGPGRWRHAERVNCPGAASVIGAVTMCAPAAGRHAGPPGGHTPRQEGRDRPARARHRALPAWEQDHRHGMSAGRNQSDETAGKPGLTSAELPAPQMAASPLIRAGSAIGDCSSAGLVIAFDTVRLSLAGARSLGRALLVCLASRKRVIRDPPRDLTRPVERRLRCPFEPVRIGGLPS